MRAGSNIMPRILEVEERTRGEPATLRGEMTVPRSQLYVFDVSHVFDVKNYVSAASETQATLGTPASNQ